MVSRVLGLFLLILVTGCGNAPAPRGEPAVPVAFDAAVDEEKIVLLCDPERFRLSIRHKADRDSVDRAYPIRIIINPESLVASFPNHGGEPQYRGDLVRYEQCGPLRVRLRGDFLNANVQGEMGAFPPFAAVGVLADNRTLYPSGGRLRLTECDETNPRWEGCSDGYAVRVDLAYDSASETMAIREWVAVGDLIGGGTLKVRERESRVPAQLRLWRSSRR